MMLRINGIASSNLMTLSLDKNVRSRNPRLNGLTRLRREAPPVVVGRLSSLLLITVLASCGGATAMDGDSTGGTTGTDVGGAGVGGVRNVGGFGGATGFGSAPSQGGAGATTGIGGATSGTCLYNGITYAYGQSFPMGDNCNSCFCSEGGLVGCTTMACPTGCIYNGVHLAAGESVPAGDGCNTCYCDAGSTTGTAAVSCTKAACVGSCSYAGTMYPNGASFASTDGCNSCSCSNGNVLCTAMACVCNPSTEYWRNYVSTSPSECASINIACPVNSAGFGNACGCGCEQSRDCPEYFYCLDTSGAVGTSGSGGAPSAALAATGGASSKTAVDIAAPSGGTTGAGGAPGVSMPVIACATAAQLAQCPLTPIPIPIL